MILLDILMPGIDGYEVCHRLKKNELTQNIPVIFVTAVSEAMDAAQAFELGAVDYVAKPFNPVTVKARVNYPHETQQYLAGVGRSPEKGENPHRSVAYLRLV